MVRFLTNSCRIYRGSIWRLLQHTHHTGPRRCRSARCLPTRLKCRFIWDAAPRWKWREQHNHAHHIILTAECACLYKWLSCGKWKSSTDMFEILLRKKTAAARIGIHRHTQARDRAGPSCCGGLTTLLTSPRRSPRMIRHGRVLAKDQQQDRQGAVTNQASSCSG